jgi:hypothetical protein
MHRVHIVGKILEDLLETSSISTKITWRTTSEGKPTPLMVKQTSSTQFNWQWSRAFELLINSIDTQISWEQVHHTSKFEAGYFFYPLHKNQLEKSTLDTSAHNYILLVCEAKKALEQVTNQLTLTQKDTQ